MNFQPLLSRSERSFAPKITPNTGKMVTTHVKVLPSYNTDLESTCASKIEHID